MCVAEDSCHLAGDERQLGETETLMSKIYKMRKGLTVTNVLRQGRWKEALFKLCLSRSDSVNNSFSRLFTVITTCEEKEFSLDVVKLPVWLWSELLGTFLSDTSFVVC